MVYVQYGCGSSAPEGWLNFDASLRVRLGIRGKVFPHNVRYGDIVRGLPVNDGTAKAVYASHILEHLTRADFETALRNTWRILMPGGTFRLIMPDLETGAVAYLRRLRNGMLDANDHFMGGIGESRPRSFFTHMRSFLDHGRHRWLWDFPSTKNALERSGFQKIRRCKYGDNPDPMFALVENKDRFVWAVSVECVK
jgi:predicted SAM-dependent methyltransferase